MSYGDPQVSSNPWDHLTPDRIFRIAMRHKIKKVRGDREREFVA
jgi:hypothetical protein